MDAFAVSLSCGLSGKRRISNAVLLASSFAFFQMIMPLIGWLLGSTFARYVSAYDHWIAFALLIFIGSKMIYESFKHGKCLFTGNFRSIKVLLSLSLATSIDAFAAGIGIGLLDMPLVVSVLIIGTVTFALSFAAYMLGNKLGERSEFYAGISGGIILIIIAVKTVIV